MTIEPTTITRPSWAVWFMRLAYVTAERGSCRRKQVGAIIVRDSDKRIISGGYNGAPRGMPDCLTSGCDVRVIDGKESCVRTIHAESNALDLAGPLHKEPHTLYSTVIPCRICALRIIQAGIRTVVYAEYYESQGTKEVEALFDGGSIPESLQGYNPSRSRMPPRVALHRLGLGGDLQCDIGTILDYKTLVNELRQREKDTINIQTIDPCPCKPCVEKRDEEAKETAAKEASKLGLSTHPCPLCKQRHNINEFIPVVDLVRIKTEGSINPNTRAFKGKIGIVRSTHQYNSPLCIRVTIHGTRGSGGHEGGISETYYPCELEKITDRIEMFVPDPNPPPTPERCYGGCSRGGDGPSCGKPGCRG